MPRISVVLPVYNGAPYLKEALDSILGQTFQDFELIAINDGSKDESLEILQACRDPRLVIVDQKNHGLAATLNIGIGMAKGDFIARQDQDDISRPDRFARQILFLEQNPESFAVGTWAEIIGLSGEPMGFHKHPVRAVDIRFFLNFNNPFVHSSVMFRKSVLQTLGGYSTDKLRQPPEDFELFSRLARVGNLANLPEVLHLYREVRGSMSRVSKNPFLEKVLLIASENIQWYFNTQDQALAKKTAAYLNGATGPLAISDYFAIRRLLLSAGPDGTKHRPLAKKILFKAFVKSLVRKPWKI